MFPSKDWTEEMDDVFGTQCQELAGRIAAAIEADQQTSPGAIVSVLAASLFGAMEHLDIPLHPNLQRLYFSYRTMRDKQNESKQNAES